MTKRQVFIDTETTGISARTGHRIVEIAAVEAVNGRLTGRTIHKYLDPQRSIDPGAQQIHGISSAALVGKPKFGDIAKDFVAFIAGAECLMHNATFDCGFIDAELARAGQNQGVAELGKVTCTLKLARKRFPGESASLDSLIVRAGIGVSRHKHSALEDAKLLADVYFRILSHSSTADSDMPSPPPARAFGTPSQSSPVVTPEALGMEKVIEMVSARQETFFYRNKHKRIIDHRVINERRWKNIDGPLLYAVTDHLGLIRYIGKWEASTPLHSRWLRHKTIHHQERARNLYIAELDAGRGPLTVWSTSIAELKSRLPSAIRGLAGASLAAGLEALWIRRWKEQLLWNDRLEPLLDGFHDGEYWKS